MKYVNTNKIIILSLILLLFISLIGVTDYEVKAELDLNIKGKSAILVDSSTGKIIYSQNPDEPLPPASMTKMMTEYLLLEAISEGKINWDDIVTASDYAHWMGKEGGSRVFLAHGEKRTVEELMYAMAVYSANDATVALAEYMAGSEANFVNLMNEKAKKMGLNNTHFKTSTGYPDDELGEYSPNISGEHVMSARDSAILAWYLINDYPEILTFTSTPTLNFREGEANELSNLLNWNWMLPGTTKAYEYTGLDGLKTGHTEQAGYNFTGTAKRNDLRLISVVMGTSSTDERFNETKKLLDFGFTNYEYYTLVEAKDTVQDYEFIPIEAGIKTEVAAISNKDLDILIKKGEQELYKTDVELKDNLKAPITNQDRLGYITYEYSGEENYEYLNEEIKSNVYIDLIAEEDIEEAGAIRLFFRKIFSIFSGIYEGIVN